MAGFMDLPCETRTLIYEYCLIVSGTIGPYDQNYSLSRRGRADKALRNKLPTVALLAVNKVIRSETVEMLYARNVWRIINPPSDYSKYAEPLWTRRPNLFRHITMVFDKNDLDESKDWNNHILVVEDIFRNVPDDEDATLHMHHEAEEFMECRWQYKIDLMRGMDNLVSAVLDVNRLYCPTGCCRQRPLFRLLDMLDLSIGLRRGPWPPNGIFFRGLHTSKEKDMVREAGYHVDET